jgi:hypothetical protein
MDGDRLSDVQRARVEEAREWLARELRRMSELQRLGRMEQVLARVEKLLAEVLAES